MNSSLVKVKLLRDEPYAQVISYPNLDVEDLEKRINELNELNIEGLIFEGSLRLGSLNLLGKGSESLVMKAQVRGEVYALKIRRTDSSRVNMTAEAKALSLANQVNVGPRLIGFSENLILMQSVLDVSLADWIKNLTGKGSVAKLRRNVTQLLLQCRSLDKAGLDHGELSNLLKHVFVDDKISIIDFESSSVTRRVRNVSSAVQWLFVGGPFSNKVRKFLRIPDIEVIKLVTKKYKVNMTDSSFVDLLDCLNLH